MSRQINSERGEKEIEKDNLQGHSPSNCTCFMNTFLYFLNTGPVSNYGKSFLQTQCWAYGCTFHFNSQKWENRLLIFSLAKDGTHSVLFFLMTDPSSTSDLSSDTQKRVTPSDEARAVASLTQQTQSPNPSIVARAVLKMRCGSKYGEVDVMLSQGSEEQIKSYSFHCQSKTVICTTWASALERLVLALHWISWLR